MPESNLAQATANVYVDDISGRWHEVMWGPVLPVKDALIWTMYMAPRDVDGEDWTTRTQQRIQERIVGGKQFTPNEFVAWVTEASNQWRKKLQSLGNDYIQLIPLHRYLFPGQRSRAFSDHPWPRFVRDLTIEGRRQIVTGFVGAGKTEYSVWTYEQLSWLKHDLDMWGPASQFAYLTRGVSTERFHDQPEELAESRLGAGQPVEQLGLRYARGIQAIANFSIGDKDGSRPSPIKDEWRVSVTFSGMLRLAGRKGLAKGLMGHVITDEAGLTIDRNLATSYIMKTWKDFGRILRKLNLSWTLLTQHEKTDFDDDMVNDSTTFVRLERREDGGKGPKGGFFTVPGFLRDHWLEDIPRCKSHFETTDVPSTIVDVRLGDVVNYMARRQSEVEAKGLPWGVMDRVNALDEGLAKFALSEGEMDELSRKKMGRLVA